MLENTGIMFIIATKEELLKLKNYEQVFDLMSKYQTTADMPYLAFLELCKLLFENNEDLFLEKVTSNLDNNPQVFQLKPQFIKKLAPYSDDESDKLARKWKDSYWISSSLGIWSMLWCLRSACKTAVEEIKNVYVLES